MNALILITLLILSLVRAEAASPELLVPAGTSGWTDPVISRDGLKIAFTNASQYEIRVQILGEDSTRQVMFNPGVGRRFIFEPGVADRIVYRRHIQAVPGKPERLLSVSIYIMDPIPLTSNRDSTIFGPYLIDNRVWYRDSLTGPFLDVNGKVRLAGPYLDSKSGELRVLDLAGKTVFTSSPPQKFGAMEISPDGQWVAAVQTEPALELFVVNVPNGTVLTVNSAADPGWSGQSLSVVCVRRQPSGVHELFRMHLPDGHGEAVFSAPDFDPETPVLNVDGSKVVFVSKGAIYGLDLAP